MFRRRIILRFIFAALAAAAITALLDFVVAGLGGPSFFLFSSEDGAQDGGKLIGALRDGMLSNILFFATVGAIVTYATWRDPQSETFLLRLLAMFPKLEKNTDLIQPIVSLIKEHASITSSAVMKITFEEFDAASDSFRIEVEKIETIVSLLRNEPYEDSDFRIQVDSDIVSNRQVLGEVSEAKLTPVPSAEGSEVGLSPARPINFLDRRCVTLTPKSPSWRVEEKIIKLDQGFDGYMTLNYWITAVVGIPFKSGVRRPARELRVIMSSSLPTEAGAIQLRLAVSGTDRTYSKDLVGSDAPQTFTFHPKKQRRPVLTIEFSAPGARLPPHS